MKYLKKLNETLLEVKLVHLGGRWQVAGALHWLGLRHQTVITYIYKITKNALWSLNPSFYLKKDKSGDWSKKKGAATVLLGLVVSAWPMYYLYTYACTQREERPREEMPREYWYLSEGGPLCTKQASQRSRFCTAIRRRTESTGQAGLLCSQRTTFTYVSNPSQLAQAEGGQGRRSICKGSLPAPMYEDVPTFFTCLRHQSLSRWPWVSVCTYM